MKRNGLSWDGTKKRTIAAFALAAVMVLPGVAQARTLPTNEITSTIATEADAPVIKVIVKASRGVSWG